MTELDHLVVAARSLDEGADWIEARLGVRPLPGGKHALMGTHNRLLRLDGRTYLEVIAIDPEAPPPARPRWFSLDDPAMAARLARGPGLIHWALRTTTIEEDARRCTDPTLEILSAARGDLRWRITVPADGHLPCGGRCATLIQWEGDAHPADRLPDAGLSVVALDTTGSSPRARIATPRGPASLE